MRESSEMRRPSPREICRVDLGLPAEAQVKALEKILKA
jgi:hypothetical protein